MNSWKRVRAMLYVGAGIIAIVLFAWYSTDGVGDVSVFGSKEESPLKKSDEVAKAWDVQTSFREIYELYSDRVVFISTEQTVKLPQHPFFNDPFFRDFFGIPKQPRSQTQKRTGLGTGFILSEDGYICTNHHVVARVDKVKVKINEKVYDAKIFVA